METKLFHCTACGYRANVIGGTERDHEVKRRSMVCRQCHAVVDAVVAKLEPGENEYGLPVDRWLAVAALCPHCEKSGLTPWPPAFPCPRCDGEMDIQ